jgi:hypothetical protein
LSDNSQVQFYAHLAVAGIVDTASFASLVEAFTSTLEEIGATFARGREAALCAGEAILIVCILSTPSHYLLTIYQAGSLLESSLVAQVIASIRAFAESTASLKIVSRPVSTLHDAPASDTIYEVSHTVVIHQKLRSYP